MLGRSGKSEACMKAVAWPVCGHPEHPEGHLLPDLGNRTIAEFSCEWGAFPIPMTAFYRIGLNVGITELASQSSEAHWHAWLGPFLPFEWSLLGYTPAFGLRQCCHLKIYLSRKTILFFGVTMILKPLQFKHFPPSLEFT